MYKIKCYRKGKKYYRLNLFAKGYFYKKNFNTLSEFARYVVDSYNSVYFIDLNKTLTKNEMRILQEKVGAILRKERKYVSVREFKR